MAPHVVITGWGSILPGDPIPSDETDNVLGAVPDLSPVVAHRVSRLGEAIKRRTGVKQRYYALDPATRVQTETNASLAEKAVRRALDTAGIGPGDIDLIVIGAPLSDYASPPTSVLLQHRLGIESCAEIEVHSNCTGSPKALQVAFDMLRSGRYRRAIVAYSQISSMFLRAEYFTPEKVTIENLALRWIMSDGAGALVLERDGEGIEIIDTRIESIGGLMEPGMTGLAQVAFAAGLDLDGGRILDALTQAGAQHVTQDITKVVKLAPGHLIDGLGNMLKATGIAGADVAEYLLGIPGRHFVNTETRAHFRRITGVDLDPVADFTWVDDYGYCGGATMLVQFDRLMRSNRLKPGAVIAAYLEESSKWMSGGFLART